MRIITSIIQSQRVAVISAIVVAIGSYSLMVHVMTTRNADRLERITSDAEVSHLPAISNWQPKGFGEVQEEFRKNHLWYEKLIEELRIKSPQDPPLIFWEFPAGHPYGPRTRDDVIIMSPKSSSFRDLDAYRFLDQK